MEGALFVLGQFGFPPEITAAEYTTFLQDNFGSAAPLIAKTYPLSAFNSTPFPAFFAMEVIITDVSYKCLANRALNLAVQNGVPAWTYLWNHTPSCTWLNSVPQQALTLLGATYTAEIPFVFGNLKNLPLPNGSCYLTSSERTIVRVMEQVSECSTGAQQKEQGQDWKQPKTQYAAASTAATTRKRLHPAPARKALSERPQISSSLPAIL